MIDLLHFSETISLVNLLIANYTSLVKSKKTIVVGFTCRCGLGNNLVWQGTGLFSPAVEAPPCPAKQQKRAIVWARCVSILFSSDFSLPPEDALPSGGKGAKSYESFTSAEHTPSFEGAVCACPSWCSAFMDSQSRVHHCRALGHGLERLMYHVRCSLCVLPMANAVLGCGCASSIYTNFSSG